MSDLAQSLVLRRFRKTSDPPPPEFFASVIEHLPLALVACDERGDTVILNRRARSVAGIAGTAPATERSFDDCAVLHADGTPFVHDELPLVRVMHGEEVSDVSMLIKCRSGGDTLVSVDGSPLVAPDGALGGAVTVMRDVAPTGPEKARVGLAHAAIEHLAAPVVVIRSGSGLIAYANSCWNRMFGYRDDEAVGRHVSAIHTPGDEEAPGERLRRIMSSLERGGAWAGRLEAVRKDGSRFWSDATIASFRDDDAQETWVVSYPPPALPR